ncbi:hypothetical protein EB796_001280 [Bugula neritina]|uniref:Uncharacterized protein n=1 Tax=Bugula neritina TaxID=10212 RepID=A0A7J7KQE4_BUGNE|nr:hypothetical protein EB796_001280 [Bugula neritina]
MVSLKMLMLLVLVVSLMPQIKAEPVPCRYTSIECKSTNSTSEEFETNCCLYGEAKAKNHATFCAKKM